MDVQALSPETIQDTLADPSSITVTPVPSETIDSAFAASTNLTTTVLNAKVLSCSDEFFAEAINLLNPGPVTEYPGVFISTGTWIMFPPHSSGLGVDAMAYNWK